MTTTQPGMPPPRAGARRAASFPRWRAPLLAGAGALAGTLVVALHSPYESGSYGYCPLHALTGLWCPMCGGLRGTYDLAHGDVAAAWGMNPLWVVAVPVVIVGWSLWLVRGLRGAAWPRVPRVVSWLALGVVVAFGVLRNVPALAPWLAP